MTEVRLTPLTVGIGECIVSRDNAAIITTHALGSCIALLLHDPLSRVAGLLHYMLPESSLDPAKALIRPFVFADTGIPLLLAEMLKLGAAKPRISAIAAGGAQMMDLHNTFSIGKRNQLALRKVLWKSGLMLKTEEVGGTLSRTISLEVATGQVQLRSPGQPTRVFDIASRPPAAARIATPLTRSPEARA